MKWATVFAEQPCNQSNPVISPQELCDSVQDAYSSDLNYCRTVPEEDPEGLSCFVNMNIREECKMPQYCGKQCLFISLIRTNKNFSGIMSALMTAIKWFSVLEKNNKKNDNSHHHHHHHHDHHHHH